MLRRVYSLRTDPAKHHPTEDPARVLVIEAPRSLWGFPLLLRRVYSLRTEPAGALPIAT